MVIEGSKAWRDLLGKRGPAPAPKAVTVKRDWRRRIYPAPVYVATFADGATVRMSFWNRVGKPWDVERGRMLCRNWHRTCTGTDLPMLTGHVEHCGIPQAIPVPVARKRVTAKQLKATLAAILRLPELPTRDQPAAALRLVTEAQELIAA